jgi:hypothetical protein
MQMHVIVFTKFAFSPCSLNKIQLIILQQSNSSCEPEFQKDVDLAPTTLWFISEGC